MTTQSPLIILKFILKNRCYRFYLHNSKLTTPLRTLDDASTDANIFFKYTLFEFLSNLCVTL